ncbi:MAG: DNA repair protein RecO (recombination protein O) [Candidatus Endobugula sp.]|jgi:DNA repair protein RecO (recombination protein O)
MPLSSVDLEPCYVLHTRLYGDTSLLVTVLTKTHGKLTLIARGARKISKSKKNPRYLLQPFIPLLLSWQGKSSLKTLTSMEADAPSINLIGNRLYSAMYLNELLVYLLHEEDPSDDTFDYYQEVLPLLSDVGTSLEVTLRQFEFTLLATLGYEINFECNAENFQPLDPAASYYYFPEQGFIDIRVYPKARDIGFLGEDLLRIHHHDYSSPSTRQTAKYIARAALRPHLRNRTLKSRELFLKHY